MKIAIHILLRYRLLPGYNYSGIKLSIYLAHLTVKGNCKVTLSLKTGPILRCKIVYIYFHLLILSNISFQLLIIKFCRCLTYAILKMKVHLLTEMSNKKLTVRSVQIISYNARSALCLLGND